MFQTLIESKRKKRRTVGGTVFSVAFHATIILLAVYATASARIAEPLKAKVESLKFVEVKPEEPKPEEPKPEEPKPEPRKPPPPKPDPVRPAPRTPAPPPVETPAPPLGFQTLRAPVEIPVRIPEVDLSARITSEADFSGKGVAGGTGAGREGGTTGGTGTGASADAGRQTFYEYEVEQTVSLVSGPQPEYPGLLREDGTEGVVLIEFVVTENGRVDMSSLKVVESSHSLFTSAVRAVLPRMRFSPARVSGRNVRQYVQQPFTFKLDSFER